MKPKEIMSLITEIEQEFPVLEWQVNQVPIWPFLRVELGLYCFFKETKERSQGSYLYHFFNKVKTISCFLQYLSYKNPKVKPVDAFFLSDGLAYIQEEGKKIDPFCDPVRIWLEELGYTSQKMTQIQTPDFTQYHPAILINPLLKFWFKAKAKFYKVSESHLEKQAELQAFLEEKGLYCPWIYKKNIISYLGMIMSWKMFFIKKLQEAKPKINFLVNYFNQPGYGLILASKSLGIKVAEFQHGAGGPLHYAYAAWPQISAPYLLLPDYFLCWIKEDVDVIAANQGRHHHGIEIGIPFIAFKRHPATETQLYIQKTEKQILLSLQPHYYAQHLVDLVIEMIKKTPQFFWIIRRHPAQEGLSEIEMALYQSDFKNYLIQDSYTNPLYKVLPYINLHITHSSSVILEAKLWGIPTLLIDQAGIDYYEGYIEKKLVLIKDFKTFQEYLNIKTEKEYILGVDEVKDILTKLLKGSI